MQQSLAMPETGPKARTPVPLYLRWRHPFADDTDMEKDLAHTLLATFLL